MRCLLKRRDSPPQHRPGIITFNHSFNLLIMPDLSSRLLGWTFLASFLNPFAHAQAPAAVPVVTLASQKDYFPTGADAPVRKKYKNLSHWRRLLLTHICYTGNISHSVREQCRGGVKFRRRSICLSIFRCPSQGRRCHKEELRQLCQTWRLSECRCRCL